MKPTKPNESVDHIDLTADDEEMQEVSPVARSIRESAYGQRIRLTMAMGLHPRLGGLALCAIFAVLSADMLLIVLDRAVDPVYDDTPWLSNFGTDLAAEYFDRGFHVPVEVDGTEMKLLTDFKEDVGVTIQLFKDRVDDGTGDVEVELTRLAMRHLRIQQNIRPSTATKVLAHTAYERGELFDLWNPLTERLLIKDVSNADYVPGREKATDGDDDAGNKADGGDNAGDGLTVYVTEDFSADEDVGEFTLLIRQALELCFLSDDDLVKAERANTVRAVLAKMRELSTRHHRCFDEFPYTIDDIFKLRLTNKDNCKAIDVLMRCATELQTASNTFEMAMGNVDQQLRDSLRTPAVTRAPRFDLELNTHMANTRWERPDVERCPECNTPILGEGGMPGALCPKCERKKREEDKQDSKRKRDDAGGDGV